VVQICAAKTLMLVGLGLIPSLSTAAAPTNTQLLTWLAKTDKTVEISEVKVDNKVAIQLKTGEPAYLVAVTYTQAARNFDSGYLLVRPKLKQTRVLADFGGQYNQIKAIKAPSHWLIGAAGSGQGRTEASYSVVIFDEWQAVPLYSIDELNNAGACGDDILCEDNQVSFKLEQSSANEVLLRVTNVSHSGTGEKMTTTTKETQVKF
jgi:hypothetical protein